MTKSEYNDLLDQLIYGHDADLSIEGHRFFIEWKKCGITIYRMQEDNGTEIAVLHGRSRNEIVNKLFDFCFLPGKSLNDSYQEMSILDIE